MTFPVADIQPLSFHLGMIYAFIEVVASGCKHLALSPPMTAQELDQVRQAALDTAAEYGVATLVNAECLVTRLFNPEFIEGKHVILFAAERATLDEYLALKDLRGRCLADGNLLEREEEIARRFGRLLSYSEDSIEGLLERPRF